MNSYKNNKTKVDEKFLVDASGGIINSQNYSKLHDFADPSDDIGIREKNFVLGDVRNILGTSWTSAELWAATTKVLVAYGGSPDGALFQKDRKIIVDMFDSPAFGPGAWY